MKYVICHLCRAKVAFTSDTPPERCPKCAGKLRSDAQIYAQEQNPATELLCPHCLGRIIELQLGELSNCPICGEKITDIGLAKKLHEHLDEVTKLPVQQLLDGKPVADIISKLEYLGIAKFSAQRYVDRLVAELPFSRFCAENDNGRNCEQPTSCDICGLNSDKLNMYEAEWRLDPQEMKRYSKGYGGFEGEFANSNTYQRRAVYCLCPQCRKKVHQDSFADGYPGKFGYRLQKITKRRPQGAPRGLWGWLKEKVGG